MWYYMRIYLINISMRQIITSLTLLLMASESYANSYDICFTGTGDPACIVIETDQEFDEVVTSTTDADGNIDLTIQGVYIAVKCEDNDNDGADDNCTIGVSDEEIPSADTVISSTCSGTTLLVQKANGLGGTYTDTQVNSTQGGYDDDPCYHGTWYVGQGNPEFEDVGPDPVPDYTKFCIGIKDGNYVLGTPEDC